MSEVIRFLRENRFTIVHASYCGINMTSRRRCGSSLAHQGVNVTNRFTDDVRRLSEYHPRGTEFYFIGHSWGAWSILRAFNSSATLPILQRRDQKVRLVAVIDPVDPASTRVGLDQIHLRGNIDVFLNTYQRISPFPTDFQRRGRIRYSPGGGALGVQDQFEASYRRHADGSAIRVRCQFYEFCADGYKRRAAGHSSMVRDRHVQARIIAALQRGMDAARPAAVTRDIRIGLTQTSEFRPGAEWRTQSGYRLVFQRDHNLVLYAPNGHPLWATSCESRRPDLLAMQGDGNVVLYGGNGRPIWATDTTGIARGGSFAIQNDGNLVVYNAQGGAVWSARTNEGQRDRAAARTWLGGRC